MNLPPSPPPPQDNNPIITQFKPQGDQWELNDENSNRIDSKTGETILHNYCRNINTTPLVVYQYLIETKGCDVNAQANNKNTPLHYALYNFNPVGGDITVLAYLLNQKRVNGNIKGQYGHTLLHWACIRINKLPLDVFKLLIETIGCDVNVQDNLNDTPLHYAVDYFSPNKGGDITILHYFLNQENVNVNIKGRDGSTLLHEGCKHINVLPIETFKLLIENLGCDVNTQDECNDTPIHRAFYSFDPNKGGDITVLTYLINQKTANVNIKGKDGSTLLHVVCKHINVLPLEIFKLVIETIGCDINARNDDNDTPLHHAIHSFQPNDAGGDSSVLHYLLSQNGVNANIKGQYGYTLLHLACIKISKLPLDVFKLVIETMGGDINAQDIYDNTPIHHAFERFEPDNGGDIQALTFILNQKGVNAKIKGRDGNTLLHLACEHINNLPLDIFKLLMETISCDVNAQNDDQDTPLHRAIRLLDPNNGDNSPVLAFLLSQENVNVDSKDEYGYTILHWACERINYFPLDVFKLLIETLGCDVNAQDNDQNTPLHLALHRFDPNHDGNIAILTYLFDQRNINVNLKNEHGYTLLHRDCININSLPLDVFKLLIETIVFDVNTQDGSNDTPIHHALIHFKPSNGGDITVLHYLLNQKGVNANIKGQYGSTILHAACININSLPLAIFQDLIETVGCDVNAHDNFGNTPLHRALIYFNPGDGGDIAVLAYIINQKGVNVNIQDEMGHNLLQYACINNIAGKLRGLNTESDTTLSQIIEIIVERCVQQVLDETTTS
jgi:ankyrin repeat protein